MIWELYAWLPTLAERTPQGQYALPMQAERAAPFEIPRLPDYTLEERILLEREILGLAISGHPLGLYGERLARYRPVGSAVLDAYVGEKVVVAGWPVGARLPRTRTGKWMAFLSLEDLDGPIEVVLFPETFQRCGGVLGLECPYLVQGQVQEQGGEIVVVAEALWAEEG